MDLDYIDLVYVNFYTLACVDLPYLDLAYLYWACTSSVLYI